MTQGTNATYAIDQSATVVLGGRRCLVEGPDLDPSFWSEKQVFLFISIMNRSMNREFLSWFLETSKEFCWTPRVCVVDEPYLFNLQAKLGLGEITDAIRSKVNRLSHDISKMVNRLCLHHLGTTAPVTSWKTLSDETPGWLKREVQLAYQKKGLFHRQVCQQVASVKGGIDSQRKQDRYARFLLCEIPVLMHCYYHHSEGIVDVYPGPNGQVFSDLESGVFRSELPKTTQYILDALPIVYVNASSFTTSGVS